MAEPAIISRVTLNSMMTELQTNEPERGAFRPIPYMGVIWVVAEAMKLGFRNGHPNWCNLGQGQPEVGEMEGAPPRPSKILIEPGDHAYGPVGGTQDTATPYFLTDEIFVCLQRLGKVASYVTPVPSMARPPWTKPRLSIISAA